MLVRLMTAIEAGGVAGEKSRVKQRGQRDLTSVTGEIQQSLHLRLGKPHLRHQRVLEADASQCLTNPHQFHPRAPVAIHSHPPFSQ